MDQEPTVMKKLGMLRRRLKEEPAAPVLAELRLMLRSGKMMPEEIVQAGRIAAPALTESTGALRIMLLGQCTTTWLCDAVGALAWKDGIAAAVTESEYDAVLQTLLELPETKTDFFVFLPWNQRLRHQHGISVAEIVERELGFWNQSWNLARQRGGRIVQIGYDYTGPGPMGVQAGSRFGGDIDLVRSVNAALRDNMPTDAYWIDLETVSGDLGRREFYDPRRYYWTKQPFSDAGVVRLADRIVGAVRALRTGSKKVLVLDLDNTLWGGVVGDLGPLGVELGEGPEGEAFRDFQRFCKELSQRGVLLAVASKNNEVDAREPFEKNPGMVLKLDDIVAFRAHWEPKSGSMREIASLLNLGIDSLVFFDDNPAEREEVRQNAPEVSVVDVPEHPWDYIRALEESGLFETLAVTGADAERTRQYKLEGERRSLEQSFTNLDDYLRSLEMIARIRPVDDGDMPRVVQLLAKTNQFNLTTRRHDEATLRRLLEARSDTGFPAIGMTMNLSDKFGEHGLIAVAVLVPGAAAADGTLTNLAGTDALVIDTFLMSCRVINRTAEDYFMNRLAEAAREAGYRRLIGEYIPTAKNVLVAELYPKFGFELRLDEEGRRIYERILPAAPLTTFVEAAN